MVMHECSTVAGQANPPAGYSLQHLPPCESDVPRRVYTGLDHDPCTLLTPSMLHSANDRGRVGWEGGCSSYIKDMCCWPATTHNKMIVLTLSVLRWDQAGMRPPRDRPGDPVPDVQPRLCLQTNCRWRCRELTLTGCCPMCQSSITPIGCQQN